jgi:hypothetical protein
VTLQELLRELDTRHVALGLRDDRLFIGARPETLGPALIAELQAHKPALEAHFRARAAQAETITARSRDSSACG